MLRGVLAGTLAFLTLVALTPTAQSQATGIMQFDLNFKEAELTLSERGRGSVELEAKLTFQNVRCVEPAKVSAQLRMAPFNKWAGASLLPPQLSWKVPLAGDRPESPVATTRLDIQWDVATAPTMDAEQVYEASFDNAKVEGGPCTISPQNRFGDPAQVRVKLPDRPEPAVMEVDVSELGEAPAPSPVEHRDRPGAFEVPVPFGIVLAAVPVAAWLGRRTTK